MPKMGRMNRPSGESWMMNDSAPEPDTHTGSDGIQQLLIDDIFSVADLQKLQDQFSLATGVASIITRPDGTPVTKPSNFCRQCGDIIRKNPIGLLNCFRSDSQIGLYSQKEPTVRRCLSAGLLDAGAGISISGRHIGNWLIGQVRDETHTE